MAGTWEEIQTAKTEKRRELTLQGSLVNKRIEESGLDDGIFDLDILNNLKIAGTSIESISDRLGGLNHLTSLSLQNNKLKVLPDTLCKLTSLKNIDISGNKLTTLPSLSELTNVFSLNANLNELTLFPDVSKLKQLQFLSISRNQLSSLPEGISDPSLSLLSTIEADNNLIFELPSDLSLLPKLSKLNVSSNKLDTLPLELSECPKLKELVIADNKMKDRKMLKLADHSTKSLLAYLGTLLDKERTASRGAKDKKGKGKKKKDAGSKKEPDPGKDVISILQFQPDVGLTVQITEPAMSVRQYVVCCILRNLDFSKSNNMFKRFISLQVNKMLTQNECTKHNANLHRKL